jgi:tRNA modification GTPase
MNEIIKDDTITAIATAPGEGAIAIVRVSGPDSLHIADRIFVGKGRPPSVRRSQSFLHGAIRGADGVADEVILLLYRSPHSYTREDSVEIQGHGGSAAAKRILKAVLDAGARMAEPGEFTKRAFLSGRIDLLQAEGVLDLIRARTDRAAHAALEQMQGTLSLSFNTLYDAALELAGDLESTLDFSEDELPESVTNTVIEKLGHLDANFQRLLASWEDGHLLRDGAQVVIAGKPNVGKSTLMNALLGKERSIVTPIAGTTRDVIEEQLVINGYIVRLIDTAGLRDSDCEIESEGVRRAKHQLSKADVIIYVIDGSSEIDDHERVEIETLSKSATIIVINKSDKYISNSIKSFASDKSYVHVSATTKNGLNELKTRILSQLGINGNSNHHASISERHRRLLASSHEDIIESIHLMRQSTPDPALAASRLRCALETLGEATGRIYHNELLNNIFSRFCIGK